MIAFDLECSEGHIFEGWFNNTASFEDQIAKDMVVCPYCNDSKVKKLLSPVTTKKSNRAEAMIDNIPIDYGKLAKEIVNYVNENFEDVGADFTKEALKMHYGVKDKRNIKGSASSEEEDVLKDEGIHYMKLPIPKDDEDKTN